jgi:hypothetical protein
MAKILDFPKKMVSADPSGADKEKTEKTSEPDQKPQTIGIDWEYLKKRMFLDDIGA